jgi:DNA-binding GntR family transcriptional regulator
MTGKMERYPIVKSFPLHLQVYENLRARIIHAEIPSGTRILESKLSKELGVSRSPVREAIRMLCSDDLLVEGSRGLEVNPMSYETTVEAYECRIVMEAFAARFAAERVDENTLHELSACVDGVVKLRKDHNPENYARIIDFNSRFHDLIVSASKHRRMQQYIEKNAVFVTLARINEYYLYHRESDYVDEHVAILKALERHDGNSAEKFMRQHAQHDLDFYRASYAVYQSRKKE